ncbi:MAG: glycine--tRNA ligase subunit beta [bacterium]
MAYFVMEVGTEEMPARFLPTLQDELKEGFQRAFQEKNLTFDVLTTYATPRRIAITVTDLLERQPAEELVVTGPPAAVGLDESGAPTKAGLGFAKSQGVDPGDIFVEETSKGAYLAVRKTVGGDQTLVLLPEICERIVSALSFAKKMRWNESGFTFGRPIRWLLGLLDETVVPFTIGGVASGNTSYGHRVMGAGPWDIPHASEYTHILSVNGRVVLSPDQRKQTIKTVGEDLAAAVSGKVVWNEELLLQVADLVEFPLPVMGRFDDKFLELPKRVLLTSMESHQKSFGVMTQGGDLLPYFLCTINIEPRDVDVVRKGWEKVLRARLEDARFFWETDLKAGLDTWRAKLENVVFLGPLGSMGDKSRRLSEICGYLAERAVPGLGDDLPRAGLLAKVDLVSEMVGEFADLQGIMGGIYAARMGENETVSKAVHEHYLPTGPSSPVPSTAAGGLLAIADKCDTLVGCFGLNMIPTGANDPYALRRQALGIIRIVIEHGFDLDLEKLIEKTLNTYTGVEWKNSPAETTSKLLEFVEQRTKGYFQSEGFETRQVEAGLGAGFSDLRKLSLRLQALQRFSREQDFEQAVLTFKRTANIIRKQGAEAGVPLTGEVTPSFLTEEAEKRLFEKMNEISPRFESSWQEEDFDTLFGLLRELRPDVDRFFDDVMVMCDDPDLRQNRLNLIKNVVDMLGRLADFSRLQV